MFFTAVNPMYANQDLEEVPYDLDKSRIAVCKTLGEFTRILNLRVAQSKGLQFYQTRSHAIALFNTLPAICIEKVVAQYTNPQGYRESYPRQICNMEVRILLIPKKQHPPTIKANEARSTRKLVARISKKLTERSTWRLVAVTSITEYKAYLTQQFRQKTLIARKS